MRDGIKHFCKVYVYVDSIVFGDYEQNLACMSIFNHSKLKKHIPVGNFRLLHYSASPAKLFSMNRCRDGICWSLLLRNISLESACFVLAQLENAYIRTVFQEFIGESGWIRKRLAVFSERVTRSLFAVARPSVVCL